MLYIVSFFSESTPAVVREIAHMADKTLFDIKTSISVHTRERQTADDYESMVAFSFPAARTYRLSELPVYIDDDFTTVRFSNAFVIFKKDITDSPWNLLRTLMPLPDAVYNGYTRSSAGNLTTTGMIFVNISCKPAVFDADDVRTY